MFKKSNSYDVTKDRNTHTINYTNFDFFHNIGKNVLNGFRQDRDYKIGKYKKIWNGEEDNTHLARILKSVDVNDTDVKVYIYKQLELEYSKV